MPTFLIFSFLLQIVGLISSNASSLSVQRPACPSIILYWTRYFGKLDFDVGIGRLPFSQCQSSAGYTNCLTTTDRGFLNDSVAVLFHAWDLRTNDLPPSGWRRPDQNFIFVVYESPINTNLTLLRQPEFKNFFNRTMTYRRDSDIVDLHPYGRLQCINRSHQSCTDFPQMKNKAVAINSKHNTVSVKIDLSSKNRTIAWFVSNCPTHSRRESLARNLSLFIPVDIYGRCGDGLHKCPTRTECDLVLSRNYRFYLSFENSLCPDYITEKLYRALIYNTVPVVYGGSNYTMYLPVGSYVNAQDFDSSKDLANYLNKLMVDDDLYLSYFHWKWKYVVDPNPLVGWCQLCRLLGNANTKEKIYPNIAEWWAGQNDNNICFPPSKYFVE